MVGLKNAEKSGKTITVFSPENGIGLAVRGAQASKWRVFGVAALGLSFLGSGCQETSPTAGTTLATTSGGTTTPTGGVSSSAPDQQEESEHDEHAEAVSASYPVWVRVTLDGQAPDRPVKLKQGGVSKVYKTDARGVALMGVQLVGVGQVAVHASHPDARVRAKVVDPADPPEELLIELERFDRSDNPDYKFSYPGTPEDLLGCGHCHNTIHKQWWGTPHQRAGSNPFVHDVYAGVVSAWQDEEVCKNNGGRWMEGIIPGTGESGFRCYKGPGALPDINPHCGDDIACDSVATDFGGCGDCHIPGMNGKIGGRNLLEAVGRPYKFGIHCDVCHKVESVDLTAAPGIAGAIKLLRPTEKPFFPLMKYRPLHFGPFMDVSNVEMGSVQREHFGQSKFCAGCHDYDTDLKPQWGEVDRKRWPTGRLPVQSTYQEWLASPMNPTAPCGSCHMPPNADVWNGADLELMHGGYEQGQRSGWVRPPGSVRDHTWVGPRSEGSGKKMLALAAQLELSKSMDEEGNLQVKATVRNVGPGHALPTGLPSRAMILLVKAYCGEQELEANGGDVVPNFAGIIEQRRADEDWEHWPKAKVGDVIRVLKYGRGWIDYKGPGPFGDGTFSDWQKGLSNMKLLREARVLEVFKDGKVRLDKPLVPGSVVVHSEAVAMQRHAPQKVGGAPGFAFARVYADKDGNLNVPSFRAVDIVIDNRIPAQESFSTNHRFAATCENPSVHAVLLYRSFPPDWIRHWQWERDDIVMTERRI